MSISKAALSMQARNVWSNAQITSVASGEVHVSFDDSAYKDGPKFGVRIWSCCLPRPPWSTSTLSKVSCDAADKEAEPA